MQAYLARFDVVAPEVGDGVGHELAPPVVKVLSPRKKKKRNKITKNDVPKSKYVL